MTIVWLNGTFGAGKTTTATELVSLLPRARAFDPEFVGAMLRSQLADRPVDDFQHWPAWRELVVATIDSLARMTLARMTAATDLVDSRACPLQRSPPRPPAIT